MESNGMSWRKEYLEMKAGLSEQQIKFLTEGPKKLTDAWALQAMSTIIKKPLNGIKSNIPACVNRIVGIY